jgi:hypothetical protein
MAAGAPPRRRAQEQVPGPEAGSLECEMLLCCLFWKLKLAGRTIVTRPTHRVAAPWRPPMGVHPPAQLPPVGPVAVRYAQVGQVTDEPDLQRLPQLPSRVVFDRRPDDGGAAVRAYALAASKCSMVSAPNDPVLRLSDRLPPMDMRRPKTSMYDGAPAEELACAVTPPFHTSDARCDCWRAAWGMSGGMGAGGLGGGQVRKWRHYLYRNMVPQPELHADENMADAAGDRASPTPMRWGLRPPDNASERALREEAGRTLPLLPPWERHGSPGWRPHIDFP